MDGDRLLVFIVNRTAMILVIIRDDNWRESLVFQVLHEVRILRLRLGDDLLDRGRLEYTEDRRQTTCAIACWAALGLASETDRAACLTLQRFRMREEHPTLS